MCSRKLTHEHRRLRLGLGDQEGGGSMGFGRGGFGEGTVCEEEGQNCLLNADKYYRVY